MVCGKVVVDVEGVREVEGVAVHEVCDGEGCGCGRMRSIITALPPAIRPKKASRLTKAFINLTAAEPVLNQSVII